MAIEHPILAGLAGSMIAGLSTGLGALPVFLRREWSERSQRLLLAGSGGVMLGATFFSLLLPALELVVERGGTELTAVSVASGGMLIGAALLWLLHDLTPHDHTERGHEGPDSGWGSATLLVLAIALHNLPEGLAVGVSYGAGATATGYAVTLGIALQNIPEGLAVAAALMSVGVARGKAFWIALATGLVEPIGGLIGATAAHLSQTLLPWGLGFAAGAMLFVVAGEIIPETHRHGDERQATVAVMVGFIVMMALARLLG